MTLKNESDRTVGKLLLTPREAAAALGISERSLWTHTQLGNVPVVRIGKSVRYSVEDLRRYITACTTKGIL